MQLKVQSKRLSRQQPLMLLVKENKVYLTAQPYKYLRLPWWLRGLKRLPVLVPPLHQEARYKEGSGPILRYSLRRKEDK